MSDFSIKDMLAMQQTLQEKYKDKWETICPEAGKHKLLWMLGEVGEVIDIIKKNGDKKTVEDSAVRQQLVEEMADVQVMLLQMAYLLKTDIQSMADIKLNRQLERIKREWLNLNN